MTVVGVMEPDFRLHLFDIEEEIYGPQVITANLKAQRKATYLKVVGRLKPGVTLDQARAEMNAIAKNLAAGISRRLTMASVSPRSRFPSI